LIPSGKSSADAALRRRDPHCKKIFTFPVIVLRKMQRLQTIPGRLPGK
jgi:hypothetical protein